MNKASISSCCNSEVITIRSGNRFVAECSYCGETIEEHIVPVYDGEDE